MMGSIALRRLAPLVLTMLVAAVGLLSCRASVPRPLPPEEVLRRTVLAQALLPHASWQGQISLSVAGAFSGSLKGSGTLENGGQRWWLRGDVRLASAVSDRGLLRLDGEVELLSPAPGTLLIRPISVRGVIGDALRDAQAGDARTWIVLRGDPDALSPAPPPVPPAPEQLFSLVSALHVESLQGPDSDGDQSFVYHLVLRESTGSLLGREAPTLRGELWIDARRFLLSRLRWDALFPSEGTDIRVITDLSFGDDRAALPLPDASLHVPSNPVLDASLERFLRM